MAFEVRNPEVEATLRNIGRSLKKQMPEGFGFLLMIFSYGNNASLFYISSGERQDVINMMREFIQKHEPN